jgi:hypothetical protein
MTKLGTTLFPEKYDNLTVANFNSSLRNDEDIHVIFISSKVPCNYVNLLRISYFDLFQELILKMLSF